MKIKLFLVVILTILTIEGKSQWDSLPSKTTLTYLFRRKKIIGQENGNNTFKLITRKNINIVIDTIINLKGVDRKLIVFSKCLNDILLNESFPIIKGEIKIPNVNGDIEKIQGESLVSNVKNFSPEEITIIYEIHDATYLLTTPKDFFNTRIRNSKYLQELDNKLDDIMYDKVQFGIYEQKIFLFFDGLSLPLKKFIIINGGNENSKYIPGINDYLFNFMRFEKKDNTPELKNKFMESADKYTSLPVKGVIFNIVYITSQYGIVKSISLASEKNKSTYINFLELEKIKLP